MHPAVLFLLAVQAQEVVPAPMPVTTAGGAPAVYHGRMGQLQAHAPRVEDAKVAIDGRLDEAVWTRASVLTGFSQYNPVDNRPAEDSTEILIWYAPTAIYFGIRAFEPHGIVNATLADRDKIDSDDRIELLLDTFNDHRLALSFAVNPLGIQADGFRNNASITKADFTSDFVFESKGRLTEYGYEVEIRIPFKSIRYQSSEVQNWGINVIRVVQHSGYENTWTPARQGGGPLTSQSGQLVGLTKLQRGLVLDVNPFALEKVNGAPPAVPATGWNYQNGTETGFSTRWGITPNLALDGAVNPDFSQVEADAGQIPQDVRFANSFSEKRPFFLDGIEKFNTLGQLIYTRRLADPVAAVRATGKLSGTDIGFVSGVDDKTTSSTGSHPIYNLLRLRRDIGVQSYAGLAYTDKVDGGTYSRMAEGDVKLVWKRQYYVDLQGAWSAARTTATGATIHDPLWLGAFDCTGNFFGCRYQLKGVGPNFRADGGFVNRTGYVETTSINRFTVIQGKRGAMVEKLNLRLSTSWLWGYQEFSPTEIPRETKAAFTIPTNARGGWTVTPGLNWETYRFDPAAYTGYRLERIVGGVTDTVAYTLPARINDVVYGSLQVSTPQYPRFALSSTVRLGMDANFLEPARTSVLSLTAASDVRPTDKLRINAQYNMVRRNREVDGTRFSTQHIPRLKVEYQLARPIFLRFVGQYSISETAAYRDPVTGYPILLRSGSRYVKSASVATNDLRMDWLFSFRPNPGTVVFFGYGSSLTETDPFAFQDVRRVRDGFFIKLSYLFRV